MNHKNTKTCNQTRAVRSEILVARHMNDKDTYYGGDMMAHFDTAGGTAVYNFLQKPSFTATVDTLVFHQPVRRNELIHVEAFVSGAGKSSVEVFTKLVATNLQTQESRLCAYAFLTFVVADRTDPEFVMPILVPESEEEQAICAGYEDRREENIRKRNNQKDLLDKISLMPPWLA